MHAAMLVRTAYPTLCVLTVTTRLLLMALQMQLSRLALGDFREVREVVVLRMIYSAVRAGVCSETRLLDRRDVPDLHPLLEQLPPAWKRELVDAITGEAVGHVCHLPTLPLEAAETLLA